MKFGICVPPTQKGADIAIAAEAMGFYSARFWDSPLVVGDVFTWMAYTACATQTLTLGTMVYVPWTRNPAVTAGALASLNAIAPGRIEICAGTGNTACRTFGLNAMTLGAMGKHLEAVMGLLRGETVQYEIDGEMRALKLIHPEAGVNLKDPIPVSIAAGGPRGRALVARLGTGWADSAGVWGTSLALGEMREAWADAGRPPEELRSIAVFGGAAILREGESRDSSRVKDLVGPVAMSALHYWVDEVAIQGKPLPDALPEVLKRAVRTYIDRFADPKELGAPLRLHRGHVMFVREDERDLVTAELMDATSFVGTSAELGERVADLAASGVDEMNFALQTLAGLEDLAAALGLGR